jgi:hypothetical protein
MSLHTGDTFTPGLDHTYSEAGPSGRTDFQKLRQASSGYNLEAGNPPKALISLHFTGKRQ